MAQNKDKDLLRQLVAALTGLSNVTMELLDAQWKFLQQLKIVSAEFDSASKAKNFWKNASEGLEPADVAIFFTTVAKLSEVGGNMSKFGTLPIDEQKKVVKEYREVTESLNYLNEKLKK